MQGGEPLRRSTLKVAGSVGLSVGVSYAVLLFSVFFGGLHKAPPAVAVAGTVEDTEQGDP